MMQTAWVGILCHFCQKSILLLSNYTILPAPGSARTIQICYKFKRTQSMSICDVEAPKNHKSRFLSSYVVSKIYVLY